MTGLPKPVAPEVKDGKMKTIQATAACVCLVVLGMISHCQAQGWRGIIPLQSTQADVERLLGPSKDSCKCLYDLDAEIVRFHYSEGPCAKDAPSGWNVPRGTVISISITLKTNPPVASLSLNNKYEREEDNHNKDIIYYVDREAGISYETYEGRVTGVYYTPTTKDNPLRCSSSSEKESHRPLKFDEYGDIAFNDEKARLDNVAIELQNEQGSTGYIIAYGGRRSRANEAIKRANRAKDYLVNTHGIEPGRVKTVDGGYREELTVELYIVATGGRAPTAAPTINSSDVQIIKGSKGKANNLHPSRPRCN
jgi:hypothetical protein